MPGGLGTIRWPILIAHLLLGGSRIFEGIGEFARVTSTGQAYGLLEQTTSGMAILFSGLCVFYIMGVWSRWDDSLHQILEKEPIAKTRGSLRYILPLMVFGCGLILASMVRILEITKRPDKHAITWFCMGITLASLGAACELIRELFGRIARLGTMRNPDAESPNRNRLFRATTSALIIYVFGFVLRFIIYPGSDNFFDSQLQLYLVGLVLILGCVYSMACLARQWDMAMSSWLRGKERSRSGVTSATTVQVWILGCLGGLMVCNLILFILVYRVGISSQFYWLGELLMRAPIIILLVLALLELWDLSSIWNQEAQRISPDSTNRPPFLISVAAWVSALLGLILTLEPMLFRVYLWNKWSWSLVVGAIHPLNFWYLMLPVLLVISSRMECALVRMRASVALQSER